MPAHECGRNSANWMHIRFTRFRCRRRADRATPVGRPTATPVDRRIPFTVQLREQWKFTDDEIKSLQFYVHDTVLLSREATEGNRIARGKLVTSSDQYEIE